MNVRYCFTMVDFAKDFLFAHLFVCSLEWFRLNDFANKTEGYCLHGLCH